jgi:gliding motility-associated-like protein
MKNISFIVILVLFAFNFIQAQFAYQRTYPTTNNDSFQVIDGAIDGNNTFVLATLMPEIPGESEALFLASFDNKGDELWSRQIQFMDAEELMDFGSLIISEGDSIYVTAIIDNSDGSPYRILASFDKAGRGGRTMIVSDGTDMRSDVINYKLADEFNKKYLTISTYATKDSLGFILSRNSYDSLDIWVKGFLAFDTTDQYLPSESREISTFAIDSTITISGNVLDNFIPNPFISKLDTGGNVIWSRRYGIENQFLFISMTDLVETADSSFIMVGNKGRNGFIMRADTMGELMWAKELNFPDTVQSLLNQVTVNANGNIICTGVAMHTTSDTSFTFAIIMDGSGNIIQQNKYDRTKAFQNLNGELLALEEKYTIIFGTSSEYNTNINVPEIIKIDEEGKTICEDSLRGVTISDLAILTDTLIWQIRDESLTYTVLEADDGLPISLDIPTLALNVRPFCPNEPIDWTFKPDVDGAIAYLWSDGSMADTLRVFEEGEYSVTVTVDEKVCFTMCDTAMLERYDLPSLAAIADYSPFCADGSANVIMQYTGEAPLDSIRWSSGEKDVTLINVLTEGSYSVTVTDICRETADTTINIDFPDLISAINLLRDDDYCANNGILLAVDADAPIATYSWGNGSTQPSLIVNTPGNYSVTVTDLCGNPFTDNVTVDPSLIKVISNVQISTSGGVNCVLNELGLSVSYQGQAADVAWNTGNNDENITVNNPGTYTVVVTDECGVTQQATIDIEECPECLEYPNAFFPRGEEELNKTFGPTINCSEQFTSYEFKVFNRWGQMVFETTNVNEEWDGQHNGNPSAGGVYVYYAKYNIGIGEQTLKGDVTLIR